MHYYLVGNTDLAELSLWAFFLFFIGLVVYLRREDRREGYPLESDTTGKLENPGWLSFPDDKVFLQSHGRDNVRAPGPREFEAPNPRARRLSPYSGAPNEPIGNPLVDGVGPASHVGRQPLPDMMRDGSPKIVPLDKSHGFRIAREDRNPIGMPVFGCDGVMAGVVSNVWVDQMERVIRYFEVRLIGDAGGAGRTVTTPMAMCQVNQRRGTVKVDAIRADQFAAAPALASDSQITFEEEDRVVGYFGGGYLYAKRSRIEPFL
ncbi:MAG: photosynthetic reaction center subunit H [Janthinobacterium lividum]